MADRTPDIPAIAAVTVDCIDLERMTRFWGELLGVEFQVVEHFGLLARAADRKVTVWLQQVDEVAPGKNRVHIDLVAGDLDASLDRVRALGGAVVERHEWSGYVWNTCTDPEGNVFDIMQAPPAASSDA